MPRPIHRSSGNIKKTTILIIALVFAGLFYFINTLNTKEKTMSQEDIIKKQREELDRIRQESAPNTLTKEEKKRQLEELDRLRKQTEPVSREEIGKQTEELNKLKIN